MTIRRRDVLKGMAAGGAVLAAGTLPHLAHAAAGRPRTLLLLSGSPHDEAFAAGLARAVRAETLRLSASLTARPELAARLLAPGARLVALLPEAEGVVLNELVRSAGARLRHAASHRLDAAAAGRLGDALGRIAAGGPAAIPSEGRRTGESLSAFVIEL